jgi:hypothetical protein
MPNPNYPGLCIRISLVKAIDRNHWHIINFKRSSFNIYRHDLTMIAFLDLLAHLGLINLIATSSKLFFPVTGLSNYHRLDLVATVPLYFSLSDRL